MSPDSDESDDKDSSDCNFTFAVNRETGFLAIICTEHSSKEERLSDICVKRLLSTMNDYNSPLGSMLLRTQRKESSHLKFNEIEAPDSSTSVGTQRKKEDGRREA